MVVRTGPHGPDGQLGHAHGDGLSFEAWFQGRKLISDTGTWGYDAGRLREITRSTASHNTVCVDGLDQLEFWGSFRVGRRGRGRVVESGYVDGLTGGVGGSWVWAAHDGYAWLPGRPTHHRLLAVTDPAILIVDAVLGKGIHTISSRLNLHPDWGAGEGDDRVILPLVSPTTRFRGPLYERWGLERQLEVFESTVDADLPWFGGWLVVPGNRLTRPFTIERDAGGFELAADLGGVTIRLNWKPASPSRVDAPRISLTLHSEAT